MGGGRTEGSGVGEGKRGEGEGEDEVGKKLEKRLEKTEMGLT